MTPITYELEEQEITILNSVKYGTLQELTIRVHSIIPFQSKEVQWFQVYCISILDPINDGVNPKFSKEVLLCGFDCFEPFYDLKRGDQISLLEDITVRLSNGQTPIALVKGNGGKILYESPGYRMGMAQINSSGNNL